MAVLVSSCRHELGPFGSGPDGWSITVQNKALKERVETELSRDPRLDASWPERSVIEHALNDRTTIAA